MKSEVREIQAFVQTIDENATSAVIDISRALTLDGQAIPYDVGMAIILEYLLQRNFFPAGFEEVPEGRKYKYRKE